MLSITDSIYQLGLNETLGLHLTENIPGGEGQRTGELPYNLAQAERLTAAQGAVAGVLEGQGAGEPLGGKQVQVAKRIFWETGGWVGT